MYDEGLNGLVKISQAIGNRPEYVQGGGGNTSAKLGDGLMAIKASGYLISQITTEEGFVAVNYEKILDYYRNDDHTRDVDYDKESIELAVNSIRQIKSEPLKRPSVEVGFHSVLKRYVIHSHSVYANILSCSAEGTSKINEIMDKTGLDYIVVPFINPGYPLSLKLINLIDERAKKGLNTDVIFLLNHGLIVTSDSANECIAINNRVNDLIKNELGLEDFPQPKIRQVSQNAYVSDTAWLAN
ncbi:MAG TPA: class II aldolase/adducin family protein, partial [Clostridia bacterium]|nr:class II aldolase/adducin family protein [Clostridia bacterium]